MPTYEYECTSCGQHIEVFQRIAEDPLTTCGVCGGPLRKVFHPAGIVFKGSGFYATDSRSRSAKTAGDRGGASKDKPAESGATGSSSQSGSAAEKPDGSKGSTPKERSSS